MPDQVASLVLKVDSTQAKGADADLDSLAQASQKAEAAVGSLGASSKAAGAGVGSLRQAARAAQAQTESIGMSAKQTANALRMLPAQMTDIVVGLTTGQSPFMVMMQQGGQLKDIFGGIGPAARAVGGYILGLVNPFTLAAAGAGALAFAYYRGSEEADRYNEAIVLTGNYAGITAGQLSEMAARIGETVGTTGKAADALARLVDTGKISGDVIEQLGQAAVRMEDATGKAVDDTIKEYARLADAPASAILVLNERYHFLTAEIYEQISALEKEGRQRDAAQLALTTYSQAMEQRAGQIQQNIGVIEEAWNSVGKAAKWAWDQMLSIGRDATPQEKIAELLEERSSLAGSIFGFHKDRVKEIDAELAGLQDLVKWQNAAARAESDRADAEARAIQGRKDLESYMDSRTGTSLAAAVAAENKAFAKATAEFTKDSKEYQDALKLHNDKVAQLEKQFAGPKGGSSLAAGVRMLEQARQRQAVLEAQLTTSEKLTTAQQELAKFEQQVADIKGKLTLTAAEKSVLAEEAVTRAVLERNVELQKEIQLRQEMVQLQVMQRAAADALNTDRQRYADELASFGLGPRAREQVQAQQRLYEDFRRQAQNAARDQARGQLSEAGYESQMEVLRQNLADRLDLQRQYYTDLRALEADWRAGAAGGLADYADMAANVADASRNAFSSAFQSMEDALADFVTSGKLSFADLAQSILNDLSRIAIRQGITGPLAAALGGIFGGISASPSFSPGGTALGGTGGLTGAWGGMRANGGPTAPGRFYEVNEKGPELYTEAGRTFLMSGARGGYVTPLTQPSAANGAATAAAPKVEVNVINQGGEQMNAQASGPRFDGEQWVIDVVLKRARNNRAFRSQLKEAVA
ncbi:phage tail tape measure protein [Bordetella petrii]|uniref:phage tail tape measure protein n=1 Tax=Bordetella petrii TaxID=94624 RepID=UPI000686A817|nr:phage tail tape measure protein [Bordetella petrii]